MEYEEDTTVTFRTEQDLKTAFSIAAKRNDLTMSQALRALMKEYVRNNSQAELDWTKTEKRR